MTPACHACGGELRPWRHLDRVDVGRGPVKQQSNMVCPDCRIVYRVTLTVWRDGLAEHQPTRHEWLTLTRGATAAKADFRCRLCGKTFTTRGSQTRHWLANHARHVNEAAM